MTLRKHGGKRIGAGRKKSEYTSRLLRIRCSKQELELIQQLGTRERAKVLLVLVNDSAE